MFQTIIGAVSSFMYSKLLVIILIGAGLYFTIRTRFPQVRLFERACESVMEKPDDKEAISSFQALMVSTASRVGTGNIVGVSSAICIGGFGSVFWMWVIAIIGSASALIESTLAQIYKKKGEDGKCYGGPAYYIEAALKSRALGVVFAIALIATYAGGFNMLASFNLIDSMSNYGFYHQFMMGDRSLVPMIGGAILAILVGMFQGGIQALSRSYFAKIIPPEKSGEYFGLMDICGKGASFLGTTIISLISQVTGKVNIGVGAISVFFVLGMIVFRMATAEEKGEGKKVRMRLGEETL